MPQLQLYFAPGTCARVPLIALEESGLAFDASLVKMMAGEHRAPPYLAINPHGKVPTLLIDGEPLTENVAILTFLARTCPEAQLLPSGGSAIQQARVLADLAWCSSTVHPIVTRLRLPFIFANGAEAVESVWQMAAEAMKPNFAWVERRLADRLWWFGEWSVVDAFLFWIWTQAKESGFDVAPYPRYADMVARVQERPSVQRTMALEARAFETLDRLGLAPKFPPRIARA